MVDVQALRHHEGGLELDSNNDNDNNNNDDNITSTPN